MFFTYREAYYYLEDELRSWHGNWTGKRIRRLRELPGAAHCEEPQRSRLGGAPLLRARGRALWVYASTCHPRLVIGLRRASREHPPPQQARAVLLRARSGSNAAH